MTDKRSDHYAELVRAALANTLVMERAAEHDAIILERIARGGGETHWFYCGNREALSVISSRLRPGSLVSFYFDNRIRRGRSIRDAREAVEALLGSHGEAVIGYLDDDGVTIRMSIVVSVSDLRETVDEFGDPHDVFWGQFPSSANDQENAITLVLPDVDGVVRSHPH